MKDQYFGDVNDFRKYGLLRSLAIPDCLRLGVCWMLTDNDGGNEGNKRDYLTDRNAYRRHDPPLFDFLSGCVVRESDPVVNRNVHKLDGEQILPHTTYFARGLLDNLNSRNQYFAEMLCHFRDCDLIFFDPDIGLEIQRPTRGNAGSSKYLYFAELVDAFRQEHSLLIYQHFPRSQRAGCVYSKDNYGTAASDPSSGCLLLQYATCSVPVGVARKTCGWFPKATAVLHASFWAAKQITGWSILAERTDRRAWSLEAIRDKTIRSVYFQVLQFSIGIPRHAEEVICVDSEAQAAERRSRRSFV